VSQREHWESGFGAESSEGRGKETALPGAGNPNRRPSADRRGSGALSLRRTVVILAVAVALLALSAASASAEYRHTTVTGQFGKEGQESGLPKGGIGGNCWIAYQSANHHLYLFAESKIWGLDRTSPGVVAPIGGGFPVNTGQNSNCGDPNLAVDNSSGGSKNNLYMVPSNNNIYGYSGSTGEALPGFPASAGGETCGVATTKTGEVWGGNYGDQKVSKFGSDGTSSGEIPVGFSFCKLAVDPVTSDLYVAPYNGSSPIVKYTAASGYTQTVNFPSNGGTNNPGMAINGAKHRLYVGNSTANINVFDTTTGALIETINVGGSGRSVAVDEATDTLFFTNQSTNAIDEIPGANVPKVTTGEPTANTSVGGNVDPDGAGNVTECKFEYGTGASGPFNLGSVACKSPPVLPFSSPQSVEGELVPTNEVQTVTIKATSGKYKLSFGAGGPGISDTEEIEATATAVEVQAKLNALTNVNTGGGSVTVSGGPGNETGSSPYTVTFNGGPLAKKNVAQLVATNVSLAGGSPSSSATVATTIQGDALTNETPYHYRLVAKNENFGGTNFGASQTITPHNVQALKTEAATEIQRTTAKLNGSFDGNGELTKYYFEWGPTTGYGTKSAVPPGESAEEPTGHKELNFVATGLTAGNLYHFRVVASNGKGESKGADKTFTTLPAVANLSTEPPTELSPGSAQLNGSFDIDALGGDTHYYFQVGLTTSYGTNLPVGPPIPPGEDAGETPGHPSVNTTLETVPGTTYHYRLVASNSLGTTNGNDVSFEAPQPPQITAVSSANVTASTADLLAQINPSNYPTTYFFEYGTTPSYGQVAPFEPEGIGSGGTDVPVSQHLENLIVGAPYHFRVVAKNQWGTKTSDDQTFEFFTPDCPNAHLRQQTGAAYLPDCRAYELVSPRNAGGIQLLPGLGLGPVSQHEFPFPPPSNTGFATSPSRWAFWGAIGQIPGTNPTNLFADTYVSTRTDNGWETHFPGVPGNEVLASGKMSCDVTLAKCISYHLPDILETNEFDKGSNSPFLYNSNENSVKIGRFPTDVEEIPYGEDFTGDGKPSGDYSHFAFGSLDIPFKTGGLKTAPGSAYDNDTAANTVEIISKAAGGGDIKQDPAGCTTTTNKQRQCKDEFIKIAAISPDGSHILMSNWAPPLKGFVNENFESGHDAQPLLTIHMTMRVNDAVSYDVTQGHRGDFVGMTPDGSRVYFTSDEKVTSDDHDTSVDLFMWSEEGDTVTRLSTGTGGDTDECSPSWTEKCSVQPASSQITTEASNKEIYTPDNWIATESGEAYFYSPEQLDGTGKGFIGNRNLYRSDGAQTSLVATFPPNQPIKRLQVTPDGNRIAVLTAAKLTSYNNSGHLEMYTIDPKVEPPTIICSSCIPTGEPPTTDVHAAENGLFMSNDGRTFFSTGDSLVPFDTDGIRDVYEYVAGRPQLISSGTGQQDTWGGGLLVYPPMTVGLEGVSANGVDVYFSTFETLVPQDENGEFIKIYDARTGGGFPAEEPRPPCKAADECHSAGSVTPTPPQVGTGAPLASSGNHPPKKKKKKKKHHKRHHQRHRSHRHG
jgi:hypothetical protein